LCNQACMVDDPRNPLVDCVVRPRGGVELGEAFEPGAPPRPVVRPRGADGARRAAVVGGGVAGLSAARALALDGARVTVWERAPRLGGVARAAAIVRPHLEKLVGWLEDECARLGVRAECGVLDGC